MTELYLTYVMTYLLGNIEMSLHNTLYKSKRMEWNGIFSFRGTSAYLYPLVWFYHLSFFNMSANVLLDLSLGRKR